ncbi:MULTISPECIES: hypothetical protein [unclassified Frankia]|uniref:hypothetical protein n=1 Tax=unclassified Frankia TaxID=2632575 RepID=UPI002AD28559|nr:MULTISPECIES: hypothetical protein [unclassified Frankia]
MTSIALASAINSHGADLVSRVCGGPSGLRAALAGRLSARARGGRGDGASGKRERVVGMAAAAAAGAHRWTTRTGWSGFAGDASVENDADVAVEEGAEVFPGRGRFSWA